MSVWKIQLRQRRQHLYNSRAVRSSRREAIKNDAEKKGRGQRDYKREKERKREGTRNLHDNRQKEKNHQPKAISRRGSCNFLSCVFDGLWRSLIGWIVISSCLFLSFFSLCCCFCCFRCFCCFCCFRCWYRWAVGNERLVIRRMRIVSKKHPFDFYNNESLNSIVRHAPRCAFGITD